MGIISYPDPSLILSSCWSAVSNPIRLQLNIHLWWPFWNLWSAAYVAGNRGIFGAARVSSYLTRQTIISSESFPTVPIYLSSRGLFLESSGNFACAESCFVFAAFIFKIKVSIILKLIKWNYQLTKQNWLIYGLGTVVLFKRFWF